MERQMGITEAREKMAEIVEQVQYQGNSFIINRHGKPAAAVVPVEVYENWKQQRNELFDLIRQMQERANLDPEEAERLAAEAVAAVRLQAQPAS
jgi:prevent-host-death family protein